MMEEFLGFDASTAQPVAQPMVEAGEEFDNFIPVQQVEEPVVKTTEKQEPIEDQAIRKVAKELSPMEAFGLSARYGFEFITEGIKQASSEYLGKGEQAEEIAYDAKAQRILREEHGIAALAGEVIGNVADPLGWLIPLGTANRIMMGLKIAGVGAGIGLVGPTEELGKKGEEQRLKNSLVYGATTAGGVGLFGILAKLGRMARGIPEFNPQISKPRTEGEFPQLNDQPIYEQPVKEQSGELPKLNETALEVEKLPSGEEVTLPALHELPEQSVPMLPKEKLSKGEAEVKAIEPAVVADSTVDPAADANWTKSPDELTIKETPLPELSPIEAIASERRAVNLTTDIFEPAGSKDNPFPFHVKMGKSPEIVIDYERGVVNSNTRSLVHNAVKDSAFARLENGDFRGALGEVSKLSGMKNDPDTVFMGDLAKLFLDNPRINPMKVHLVDQIPQGRGAFRNDTGELILSKKNADIETFLHESAHAAGNTAIFKRIAGEEGLTVAEGKAADGLIQQYEWFKQQPKLQQTLEEVLVQAERQRGARDPYASARAKMGDITDKPVEFFAYGFTNPPIRKVLQSVPYETGTFWSKVVDKWRDIIGLPIGKKTQFDRFMGNAKTLVKESSGKPAGLDTVLSADRVSFMAKKGLGTAARSLETGNISPQLLARLASTSGGAIAGAALNPNNPLEGAIGGAALGLGISTAGIRAIQSLVQKAVKSPAAAAKVAPMIGKDIVNEAKPAGFSDLIKAWDHGAKRNERLISQGYETMRSLAKNEAEKDALLYRMDTGERPNDPAVKTATALFDSIWEKANKEGVVNGYEQNYITHLYDWGKQSGSATLNTLRNMVEQGGTSGKLGITTPFEQKRLFKTYQLAAEKAGLIPLTTDPAQIYVIHANSMLKAGNNKQLITELRKVINPETGDRMVRAYKQGEFPEGYGTVNSPQFRGYAVDKSIIPTLESMFSAADTFTFTRIAHGVSLAAKKGLFAFSGFHLKALGEVALGAARNPKVIPRGIQLLKMYREGGAGDMVDTLLKGGLEVSHGTLDTAHKEAWGALVQDVTRGLEKIHPYASLPVKGLVAAEAGVSKVLWEVVHPMLKLGIAEQEFQRLLRKRPDLGTDAIGEMSARFTNDIFGGQNWLRNAIVVKSPRLQKIALEMASARGRQYMQIAALAPDWAVSSIKSWTGALKPGPEGNMYRKYLMQSLALYATIGDALNLHYTGKHFWENEDPLSVEMGDGRRLQLSKHLMEVPHLLSNPADFVLGKLGYIPQEMYSILFNRQYASTKGAPAVVPKGVSTLAGIGYHFNHALKGFVPISAMEISKNPVRGIAGALGVPIRGKSYEERDEIKQERKQVRRLTRRERELEKRTKQREERRGR